MVFLLAATIFFLTSCENGVTNPIENPSEPDYSIYLISSDGVSKYMYDEDSGVATKVISIPSSPVGKAIDADDSIAVPVKGGYQKLSFDLENEGVVDLGFDPRMIVLYDGTIDAVAESTMLFNGTVVEFDETINDAKPGPDGLYVASGKIIYTLPGKNLTMAQWTEPITAIAVDDTGSIYMGVNGKVLIKELGEVSVNGTVKNLVLKDDYLYALTDMGYIYKIDVNDIKDVKSCSANITDFFVIDDKIFYVSNFNGTFGVYDIDSCNSNILENISGEELIGILAKEE